jgi:hypothetical protein
VEPERPLLADIDEQVRALAAGLGELLALRYQLAMLEIQSDVAAAKRLAGAAAAAGIMGLTGLPLLAACAAEWLDGRWGLSRAEWFAVLGAGLVGTAALVGWNAWHRFRRQWLGLEETLEEFREDLLWLQDWTSRKA